MDNSNLHADALLAWYNSNSFYLQIHFTSMHVQKPIYVRSYSCLKRFSSSLKQFDTVLWPARE